MTKSNALQLWMSGLASAALMLACQSGDKPSPFL